MQNIHLLGNTEHIQIVFLKIIVINSDLFWYGAVSSVGRASRLHSLYLFKKTFHYNAYWLLTFIYAHIEHTDNVFL